jgi:hypothetical protein
MLLPAHEILADRKPDYTELVQKSASPAFFFGSWEGSLENEFCAFLSANNITSAYRKDIGGSLYFNLSRPVDAVVRTRWNTTFQMR